MIPTAVAVLAAWAVVDWVQNYRHFTAAPRVAGLDKRPDAAPISEETADLTGTLKTFDGTPSAMTASWPGFRGQNRDGILEDRSVPLAEQWPAEGLPKLWAIQLGEGYAGAAVHNGRVYVIDYDMEAQADAIRCFSLDDGREIWRYSYPVRIKRNHGMSRTVPTVNDDYIVTIGPKCHVVCLNAKTGEFIWMIDLVREYGTAEPLWYAGQCPLIVNNTAILAPAGPKTLMMAVDCKTGSVLWEAPNPGRWKMTHTSILPMSFGQTKAYVYAATDGIAAVSASDGKLLWKTETWKLRIGVASPIDVGDGKVFVSGGYNKGAMMLQIEPQGETFVPKVLFELKPEIFGADQQTPICYNGAIYGVRPDKQLVCIDLDGTLRWTSGSENKYGLGAYIIANNLLYLLDDNGVLSLIRVNPDRFEPLAKTKALDGHESWGPPALAGGRLIIRDLTTMACMDVSAQ